MRVSLRKKLIQNDKISLYLEIYHNGKKQYEFLNLYLSKDTSQNKEHNKEVESLAKKIRNQRELELTNNLYGHIPKHRQKINLIDFINQYINDKNNYHSIKQILINYSGDTIYFKDIDINFIEGLKRYLTETYNPNTANRYFSNLKYIFRQAILKKIITQNPFDYVSNIKRIESKKDFLTIDEIQRFANVDIEQPEIKRAFLFSCFTGLRYSDIIRLKWSNVKGDYIELTQKKTKDVLYIPLNETSKKLLYQNNNILNLTDNYVFNIRNKVIKTSWIIHYLKRMFKKAGIDKKANYHISRHTFAVMNITSGNEIYTLSKLLGHKDLKSTQIYSKLIDEKKKEAINKLPNLSFN